MRAKKRASMSTVYPANNLKIRTLLVFVKTAFCKNEDFLILIADCTRKVLQIFLVKILN